MNQSGCLVHTRGFEGVETFSKNQAERGKRLVDSNAAERREIRVFISQSSNPFSYETSLRCDDLEGGRKFPLTSPLTHLYRHTDTHIDTPYQHNPFCKSNISKVLLHLPSNFPQFETVPLFNAL